VYKRKAFIFAFKIVHDDACHPIVIAGLESFRKLCKKAPNDGPGMSQKVIVMERM